MDDLSYLLNDLNDKQREAVSAPAGHHLVLAGAGSGKTRVLTHRIGWLIDVEHSSPFSILAVTFTNKAAAQMRSRLEQLRGVPSNGMWVGTFHSIAHRLLRAHWKEAKLSEMFQIMDSNDQYRLIRRVLKDLELSEEQWSPKQIQWFINAQKDQAKRPHHIQVYDDYTQEIMIKIYSAYEAACERAGLIDFAELLLRSHELWLENPELLAHYQQRFSHILVDEFQDTNALQYAWLRLLAGKNNSLMIVGDDDQSIYGWRGARIENILRFEHDYTNVKTTRLEQNYRSTKTILSAANAVISHNGERLGKELWTNGKEGELISLYEAFNELDEAKFVVGRLRDWFSQGNRYDETAILYRSNAQSRVLEEALLQSRIPYRVYGGQRFFERVEIKDALAYLRLIANRTDDSAFERIINTPTRGIGDRTVELLRETAREQKISLWASIQVVIQHQLLPARATSALTQFVQLIDRLTHSTNDQPLHEQMEFVIHESGLYEFFKNEKGEKAQMRLENLAELVTAARQFEPEQFEEGQSMSILQAFLSHAALESGEEQAELSQDSVQLMTLHAAKGLEFPLVFLVGVEEGLFPHEMSASSPEEIEEERRLCYVGITRAMQKLYLTYATIRRLHGKEVYHTRSRFLQEIPDELIEEVRVKNTSSYNHYSRSKQEGNGIRREPFYDDMTEQYPYKLGQLVEHPSFGYGIVLDYEGAGEHLRIQIKFNKAGTKWLMFSKAQLSA
jgi:DNA helicase-2/ATP-dependent DNA helicase PcrA